jgi:hypothetical protein
VELALENAVEGCVHETFAAARAAWQASYASDPSVRSLSAVLAADEAAHADLAADVHAWACSVLPPRDAQRDKAARRAAWAQLANNPAPVTRRPRARSACRTRPPTGASSAH